MNPSLQPSCCPPHGVLSESRRLSLSRTGESFTQIRSSLTFVIFSNLLSSKILENVQKNQRETKTEWIIFFAPWCWAFLLILQVGSNNQSCPLERHKSSPGPDVFNCTRPSQCSVLTEQSRPLGWSISNPAVSIQALIGAVQLGELQFHYSASTIGLTLSKEGRIIRLPS